MPTPFLPLTIEEFSDVLRHFPWTRRVCDVHVHHTVRPNHADFAARPGVQSIEDMYRVHTGTYGFRDIAQHVTIDPAGTIWTGRHFNAPPASATGFNGNAGVGPFMVEIIGNFDEGRDPWKGAQREAAIEVIARVQKIHHLPPAAIRFHHEMSSTSCPGPAIKKAGLITAVKAAQARLSTPRAAAKRIPKDRGRQSQATAALMLRLFNVDAQRLPVIDETELPDGVAVPAILPTATSPALVRGALAMPAPVDAGTRAFSADDLVLLRKHVINLRMGALSMGGEFQTSREDVLAMFSEHVPAFLEARRSENGLLRLVFFAHGGLNDEDESLRTALNRIPFYLENKCYPIFFVWETGAKETLVDILRELIGLTPEPGQAGAITDLSDAALEAVFRNGGFAMWANMKRSAELAFLPKQGGAFLVDQIVTFWQQHSAEMEIHAIGHSAGSIFHAHFLDLLCRQPSSPPVEVRSLHLLAPAITIDLFKQTLMPLIGGRLTRLVEFTMHRDFELADTVGPYRKSLLYLVSRSFEDAPEMPILGLEESLRRDPDLIRVFGLLGHKTPKAEILFSVEEAGPSHSTIARRHGDFDNDRLTMGGVMRRILDVQDETPIVEFPETVSQSVLDAPTPPAMPRQSQLVALGTRHSPRVIAPAEFAAVQARLADLERRVASLGV